MEREELLALLNKAKSFFERADMLAAQERSLERSYKKDVSMRGRNP